MSQHDYVIDNANGAAVRVDFNNALGAIQSNNSGGTSPTATTPFQWWFDITANDLKIRNSGDTAWVSVFDLTGSTITPFRGTTLLGNAAEQTVGTVLLTNLPNVEDIQNQQGIYLAAAGSVNVFTLALVPAIAGYVEGQLFGFKANLAITAAPTLDVNSKGAGAITWPNGDVLITGDILINQHVMVRRTANAFVMLGSRTVATQLEAEAGVQNTRIMTALRVEQAITDKLSGGIIGQTELKTTIGDMVATGTNSDWKIFTGPGGEHGFWPTVKSSTTDLLKYSLAPIASTKAGGSAIADFNLGTAFLQRFVLGLTNVSRIITARQRYVQASQPYNMGDGDVFSFIFAIINNANGLIEATYHAPDPPWANNGPTNIRPDRIDPATGKQYKTIQILEADKLLLMDPDFITETEIEITADYKNSDMDLIPHPFQGNDLTGKTIVIFDPMSPIVERLEEIKNAGGDVNEIIFGNFLNIGTTELNRGRPPGVMSVSIAMK